MRLFSSASLMPIDLDNIPRTVFVDRASAQDSPVPEGFPMLAVLDQTKLPGEVSYIAMTDWRQAIDCIKRLKVRGAPAIGIAGAAAVMLRAAEFVYASADGSRSDEQDFDRVFLIDEESFDSRLYETAVKYSAEMVKSARPTAVNLAWAVDSAVAVMDEGLACGEGPQAIEERLYEFVQQLIADDEAANRRMGELGAQLLPDDATVLTHCNAGSLATAFFGTALGVVYTAAEGRGVKRVYADETRPVLQGARLTAWELSQAGVPVTLICDDMAASVLASGQVDAVIVGADRIAANGDVANKVGTFGLAVMAKHFGVPLYVVAPTSTIDASTASGADIPIEQRDSLEVLPQPIDGVDVFNPAFDVTPAGLVTKVVTERGVFDAASVTKALS